MSEYNIQMNKYNALNAGYDQLYPQPMKHANTHAKDGSDPITPASIGAATSDHTHDDRYYTEAEVNNLLSGKQDASSAINTGNIGSQTVNNANRILEGYDTYDVNTLTEGFRVYKCISSSSNLPLAAYGHLIVMQSQTENEWAIQLFFPEANGDGAWKRFQSGGSWTPWVRFIDSDSIGSQSVNYANGAGNSDTVDGWHMNLDPGGWGIKPICAGTGDMAAGSTALSNGHIYLVYE